MATPGFFVHSTARGEDRSIRTAVTLRGADELQIAMLVDVVVPVREAQCPALRLLEAAKHTRIVRSVLASTEQTLNVRVVIAHAGTVEGSLDTQLLQLRGEGRSFHYAAIVLMDH